MTPEERKKLDELIQWKQQMERSSSIPLRNEQALVGRGFIKGGDGGILTVPAGGTGVSSITGVVIGQGTSKFTSQAGQTIVVYVADSSGGAVTRKLTFTSGVLTGTS